MGRTDTESHGFMVTCLGDKLQSDLNVLAQEIVEDLEATLEQFREITTNLGR